MAARRSCSQARSPRTSSILDGRLRSASRTRAPRSIACSAYADRIRHRRGALFRRVQPLLRHSPRPQRSHRSTPPERGSCQSASGCPNRTPSARVDAGLISPLRERVCHEFRSWAGRCGGGKPGTARHPRAGSDISGRSPESALVAGPNCFTKMRGIHRCRLSPCGKSNDHGPLCRGVSTRVVSAYVAPGIWAAHLPRGCAWRALSGLPSESLGTRQIASG